MLNKLLKVFLPESDQRKKWWASPPDLCGCSCDDRSVQKQLQQPLEKPQGDQKYEKFMAKVYGKSSCQHFMVYQIQNILTEFLSKIIVGLTEFLSK